MKGNKKILTSSLQSHIFPAIEDSVHTCVGAGTRTHRHANNPNAFPSSSIRVCVGVYEHVRVCACAHASVCVRVCVPFVNGSMHEKEKKRGQVELNMTDWSSTDTSSKAKDY